MTLEKRPGTERMTELLTGLVATITDEFMDFLAPSRYDAASLCIAVVICGFPKTPFSLYAVGFLRKFP
jgi:hypothetical protein